MKKILSAVLLALLCGSGTAFASDNSAEAPNTKQLSVGYEGVFAGDLLQGLSSRYWFNDNVGGEVNLFYGRVGLEEGPNDFDADLFLGELKLLYAPIVNENSRFYVGLEGGIGSIGGDIADDADITVYTISPFVGTEFRFAELPDMAFNWEVGYKWHRVNVDPDDYEDLNVNIDGTFVTVGAHYYF